MEVFKKDYYKGNLMGEIINYYKYLSNNKFLEDTNIFNEYINEIMDIIETSLAILIYNEIEK